MRLSSLVIAALLVFGAGATSARAVPPEAAAANEDGAGLFAAGSLKEAAARFETALALAPDFDLARRNLSAALATLGQQEMRSGDADDARAHLERAILLSPAEAPYHLLLAALHFSRGDLYAARQYVDRSLELAPDLGEARELSGDIHYQEGWLARAQEDWKTALTSSGARTNGLRAKIDRAAREVDLEGGFNRDVSRHFTVQYDGPVTAAVARTALLLLEEAYDRLWTAFGRSPQHDIPVILYTRGLFDEITRSPGWVAGTYDGKIRIPVGGLSTANDAERLGPVLAHELTHAFIRVNVPGRLPLWFEEGLAGHFQGLTPEAARRTLRAGGGAFPSLVDVDVALRGGPRVGPAYAAALVAVAEMLRLDGFWLPRRTLELLAAGRPFQEAFREASGIDLAEFEERWREAQR